MQTMYGLEYLHFVFLAETCLPVGEGACCRGLHWVWAPKEPVGTNAKLAAMGGFTFAAGGSGRSESFAGDPRVTVGFGVY